METGRFPLMGSSGGAEITPKTGVLVFFVYFSPRLTNALWGKQPVAFFFNSNYFEFLTQLSVPFSRPGPCPLITLETGKTVYNLSLCLLVLL